MRGKSIYADLYVKYSYRALRTPRVARFFRQRVIAWAGPTAFMRDRFYELDSWYKARIHKPELLPQLHLIDPDLINYTLEDRLASPKNCTINIGFRPSKASRTDKTRPHDPATMEKLSRKNLLRIEVEEDLFNDLNLVAHYHIFEDMFSPSVYFYNTQKLDIRFDATGSTASDVEDGVEEGSDPPTRPNSVHFGCVLATATMRHPPAVTVQRFFDYSKTAGSGFSTLLMLNLDGDALANGDSISAAGDANEAPRRQVLHWLAENIPDARPSDDIDGAHFDATTVPYLQPLPFRGTGYHRIVFLLLRHARPLDFATYFPDIASAKGPDVLRSRLFNINAFVKSYEGDLTPSACKFCQVIWDESCDETLHGMGLKSPHYWYEWNEALKPEQKEFPLKPMPFHHYLNMYRPAAKVRRKVASHWLEMLMRQPETDDERVKKPAYPDMFYQDNVKRMPSWVHREHIRRNVGWGPYAALYDDYVNPAEQHMLPDEQKHDSEAPKGAAAVN